MFRNRGHLSLATIIAVAIILAAGWMSYLKVETEIKRELKDSLFTVLDNSHKAVKSWSTETQREVMTWANIPAIKDLTRRLLELPPNRSSLINSPLQEELRQAISPFLTGKNYFGFFIIGPDNLNYASLRDENIALTNLLTKQETFLKRVWSGETALSLPMISDVPLLGITGKLQSGEPTMFVGAPIRDETNTIIAVLTFRINPATNFSEILQRARIGKTGETYAFNKAGKLISESRFDDQLRNIGVISSEQRGILNVRVQDPGRNLIEARKVPRDLNMRPLTLMAASAVSGESDHNLEGYNDYRGVPVIGAWLWDEELDYGIATEIDVTEAFGILGIIRGVLIGFSGVSATLMIFLTAVFFRGRRNLEVSEQQQRDLLNNTSSVIYIKDMDGKYLFINRKYEELFNISNEEIKGKTDYDLFPEEMADAFRANDLEAAKMDTPQETEELVPQEDGNHTYISVKFPLKTSSGDNYAVCGISTDITERKKIEKALLKTEAQLEISIESISDGFALFDANDKFVFANTAYRKTHFEIPDDKLTTMTFEDIVRHLAAKGFYGNDPDEIESFVKKRLAYFRGDKPFEYCAENGRWYDVHEYKTSDGGVALVRSDTTDRRQLEEQFRRTHKMEAVGQLTGGIAHDFNNILGIVMGNLEIIEQMVKGDEKISGRVATALRGARRGAELTRKLLGFSSRESHEAVTASVNEIVHSMDELLTKSLTVAVGIEHNLADDLWSVKADPGDLQDAILNLALNAHDAMPDGGILKIETSNNVLDENYVKRNPGSRVGEFVMLSLSDNGEGMSEKVKERVLEPFFSTKEEGRGSGLGLSMVYGFVQRSEGHIHICSELGKGTTVSLYLPRAAEEEKKGLEEEAIDIEMLRGDETILVVDDEEALTDIAVLYLEELGYKTLSAHNGEQALEVLNENKDIDMLFTDVIMPGKLDGYQLAVTAQKNRSNLKVLITSGFTKKKEDIFNPDDPLYTKLSDNLLNKPYNQAELAMAVRNVLD